MNSFLAASDVIDWQSDEVLRVAESLSIGALDQTDFVRRAFGWVRDEVRHSGDFDVDQVTCSASETLRERTGFCYAKSHLFVALCRARGIQGGLGYQRLSIDGAGPPFCLHGFAVIDLGSHGWRRLDPRGNKRGIATEFCVSADSLAFTPRIEGECTWSEILAEPLPVVVQALRRFRKCSEFVLNLPDSNELGSLPEVSKLQRCDENEISAHPCRTNS
jgi:hypothetical protein